MVPWVCPQFVIVVFYDHTHILFLKEKIANRSPVFYIELGVEEKIAHQGLVLKFWIVLKEKMAHLRLV